MPSAGFKHTVAANERPQTYASDRDHRQWRTQEFFSGGVQQSQLRTEDREDGDLGVVAL